jgi:hypothetical protein
MASAPSPPSCHTVLSALPPLLPPLEKAGKEEKDREEEAARELENERFEAVALKRQEGEAGGDANDEKEQTEEEEDKDEE